MMPEFKSWESYNKFEWDVKKHNRYIRSPENEEFLQILLKTSEGRKAKVQKGKNFWRAQLGHCWEKIKQGGEEFKVPCPFSPERMKPNPDVAREGRANPKGISYLYAATNRKTAMAEIRPWIGSYISVGQFKLLKNIVLVDCSLKHGRGIFYLEEPDSKQKEAAVWAGIENAFSEPVNINDTVAEYVPTQIIAELFKSNGYDGIYYKSLLGKGYNVVLFDINAADLINCFLFEAKKVSFTFKETAAPYFLRKYYKK